MRTHHPFLPRPWRGLGWAGPLAGYPSFGWATSLTGYSGLGWATPDTRRLPDTPCPDTVSFCDHSPSSPSRDLSPGALHNLRHLRPRRCPTTHTTDTKPNRDLIPHRARTIARPPTVGSPPPRSARLGSTTSPGRRAPISSTPPPADLQSVPPPLSAPLHPTAPDPDAQAAAAHLSNTLLNYSHSDWEQAQRDDPLCDATRRYIQLGCPQHRLTSLCDHIPSHRRPASTDILDLAVKGRLIQGDYGTALFVRNPVTVASSPVDTPARLGRLPFNDPVRIYVPLLARPWIMHACHADASCHLGVTRTLKMLERFYWWVGMKVCTKWWVRRCLKCQARKTSRQTVRWPVLPIPPLNSPGVAVCVDYFGPLPITARGNSYILLFTDRFSRRADMLPLPRPKPKAPQTSW